MQRTNRAVTAAVWRRIGSLQKKKGKNNMISFCILDLNVNNPSFKEDGTLGINQGNGLVNLKGDAPAWRYCELCLKAVVEGAVLVTAWCPASKPTHIPCYVVVHSALPEYIVGTTVDACTLVWQFGHDINAFEKAHGRSPVLTAPAN